MRNMGDHGENIYLFYCIDDNEDGSCGATETGYAMETILVGAHTNLTVTRTIDTTTLPAGTYLAHATLNYSLGTARDDSADSFHIISSGGGFVPLAVVEVLEEEFELPEFFGGFKIKNMWLLMIFFIFLLLFFVWDNEDKKRRKVKRKKIKSKRRFK